jgi:hypothetical protein
MHEIPDPYLYSNDSYVFTTPFLMNVDFNEFPKVNSYVTTYSKDIGVSTKLNSVNYDTANQINVNSYNVSRNNLVDLDRFKLQVNVLTDLRDVSMLVPVARLYRGNQLIGVAKMKNLPDTTSFYLDIKTSDAFTALGEYILDGTFYQPSAPDVLIPEIHVNGTYRIDIAVYNGSFTSMDDTPIVEYVGLQEVGFAEDVSEVVYCPINLNQLTGSVVIERLPLVNGNFFFNEAYNRDMMATILQLFSAMRDATELLENNTALDMKFFNTMGVSKNFTSDTVDLRLKFQVKLKTAYSVDTDAAIKKAVVKFVEEANTTLDKRFSTSNMISVLERAFPSIAYIQLYSVNSANIQNVEASVNPRQNKIDYVPEYLTVKKLSGSDDQGNGFLYDISIEYL